MTTLQNHLTAFALACVLAPVSMAAQRPPENPACRKDSTEGIVCAGTPPVVASVERPVTLSAYGVTGRYDGFQLGVRYDPELRGRDNLAHADIVAGRVSHAGTDRTFFQGEIMGAFAAGLKFLPVGGMRSSRGVEISHPFSLILGARTGRPAQSLSALLETGVIRNRNNDSSGFETTVALTGYRSFDGLAEISATVRGGMGWGAGGAFTGFDVRVTRRIGSFARLNLEWMSARLASDDGLAARENALRIGIASAPIGRRSVLKVVAVPWTSPPPGSEADSATDGQSDKDMVSADERERLLARAQIHLDTNVSSRDVFAGPEGKGAFAYRQEVECTFNGDADLGGNTPKFECLDAEGDKLKVKYGCDNGEVFGEVAATRLLWLLGFPADRMYPVVVKCKGCPPMPSTSRLERETGRFECASIERKTGDAIVSFRDQGWSFQELTKVNEAAGGAPRAHVDALRLLMVLIQHNDSKDNNQRIICKPGSESDEKPCRSPLLVVQDLGSTFGGAGNRVREDSKADLQHWRQQMIWRDGKRCIANLAGSTKDGTILDPQISEEGRALLASLLRKVSAAQIHDLFRVSQVTLRDRGTTLAEWESAFWYKAYQIDRHRCE